MKHGKNSIDKFLSINSQREFMEQPTNWYKDFTLPEAQSLTKHLEQLSPSKHVFRLGLIHTYTSDLLDPWFNFHAAIQGIDLCTYHAPYGMNIMESQTNSGLFNHNPDLTLFLLTQEDLHPEFVTSFPDLNNEHKASIIEETVKYVLGILTKFRSNIPGQIVLTILPRIQPVALGLYDAQTSHSENVWWTSLKEAIASELADKIESSMFLDMDQVLIELGRSQFFDLRFWYTSRFPFTTQAANEFAKRVLSLATISKFPKAKVIVLDADNTMWGGIIGEDGINGIALGPEYPGNTYVDFQRRILDYQKRGFILAICSKNNSDEVMDVLENHPHQVLRTHHFATKRINWLPKHENIISISEELNLGMDSFIFVDDSAHECAAVRSQLPQVQVIQTPSKPVDIPSCLEQVSRLEILSLTKEDLQKTQLYAQEIQRRNLQDSISTSGGSIDAYLTSLEMKMNICFDAKEHISRLAQLTQKTNQFNLTTRRYDEKQLMHFIESEHLLVCSFSLKDIFGDSGIVGLAIFKNTHLHETEIDTFLMSCRVIGRQAESAFLLSILDHLASNGITNIVASYSKTAKNSLVENFYKDHGFTLEEDGLYRRNLIESPLDMDQLPPIDIFHNRMNS